MRGVGAGRYLKCKDAPRRFIRCQRCGFPVDTTKRENKASYTEVIVKVAFYVDGECQYIDSGGEGYPFYGDALTYQPILGVDKDYMVKYILPSRTGCPACGAEYTNRRIYGSC